MTFVFEDNQLDEPEYAHLLQCGQCLATVLDIVGGSHHESDDREEAR
jgi:hypothetical protein